MSSSIDVKISAGATLSFSGISFQVTAIETEEGFRLYGKLEKGLKLEAIIPIETIRKNLPAAIKETAIEEVEFGANRDSSKFSGEINLTNRTIPFEVSSREGEQQLIIKLDELDLIPHSIKGSLLPSLPSIKISDLRLSIDSNGTLSLDADWPDWLQLQEEQKKIGDGQNADSSAANIAVDESGDDKPKIKWFDINKGYGPVHLNKIGVTIEDFAPKIVIDSAFTIAGLNFRLLEFGAKFPLNDFPKPTPTLSGMELGYDNGAVAISGAFLKQQDKEAFSGYGLVKGKAFNLTAFGGYESDVQGSAPSFFLYALYNKPLGGPTFFFVTGLAMGIGINKTLKIPTIEKVGQFPLIAAAKDGSGDSSHSDILKNLQEHLQPQPGALWFAAGVKFTSFKLIRSFALLILTTGNKTRINLLGISTMAVKKGSTNFIYARMLLKATFAPDEGVLGIQARLAPDSYIFQKNCRISGGFALYQWFSGKYKDDFVVSWGGYHPSFIKPTHYPALPRLAINWPVNSNLHIKGQAYMAITPSALMAGGRLEAVWEKGSIRAWFNLEAHFLIMWQPFQYAGEFRVSVGARFSVKLVFVRVTKTISVTVGVTISGPPFSGKIKIDLKIISFSIPFGSRPIKKNLSWNDFKSYYLPAEKREWLLIQPIEGLLRDLQAEKKNRKELTSDIDWIFDPDSFKLQIKCLVPFTASTISGVGISGKSEKSINFRIKPSGISMVGNESSLTITITGHIKAHYKIIPQKVPDALWGSSSGNTLNGARLTKANTLIEIVSASPEQGETRPFTLDELLYKTIAKKIVELIDKPGIGLADHTGKSDPKLFEAINVPKTTAHRKELLDDFEKLGIGYTLHNRGENTRLSSLQNYQSGRFWDWPKTYNE